MNPNFPTSSSEANGQRYNGMKEKTISLSQLKPFLDIAIPFFREDKAAFCSLVGIIVLTLVKAGLLIFFSYVRRDMFSALNHKNAVEFYEMIVKFFGVLVVFVPIAVLYHYLRLRLALYWRKELTARVLDKYYANRTYYIMECCKDIDNPDQRISEDLREFTSTSLDFFFILFKAVINLLSFSIVLYHICPLLFIAIICYAVMGTAIAARLGKSLVGQYYNKLQSEANFRFGLIRTRENAEGIAFYDSEASMEQVNIWNLFEEVRNSKLLDPVILSCPLLSYPLLSCPILLLPVLSFFTPCFCYLIINIFRTPFHKRTLSVQLLLLSLLIMSCFFIFILAPSSLFFF